MVYSRTSKRMVQIATAFGSSLAPFMVGAIFVAAPTIGDDYSADVALLGWLTAAFFLVAAACLVPFGRVADVKGAKRVFTAGLGIYVASALLAALSPDIYVLILARALTGVGAAMIFGTSIALLGLVFAPEERGKAIGINVTAMFIGFTLGLLAGGFLSYYISWRGIFLIVAIVAAVLPPILSKFGVPSTCCSMSSIFSCSAASMPMSEGISVFSRRAMDARNPPGA